VLLPWLHTNYKRGAANLFSTDPPVNSLNPRPIHPPSDFFLLGFFFSAFLGVSRQAEFKTPYNIQHTNANVFAKSPCRKRFPEKSTKFLMSVFPRFFVFVAFLGVSRRWEFKSTTKNVLQKGRVEKFLQTFDQKSKTDLFSIFLSRFWRLSVRGVQKLDQNKYQKNKSDPSPFLASDPPAERGPTGAAGCLSCFWRSLGCELL
jgi:hypothetical protein